MRLLQILALILFTKPCFAQVVTFSNKAQKLTGIFNLYHIQPPANDQKVSSEIIDLFITELDNTGIILKESDVTFLRKNNTVLFTEIKDGKNDYLDAATLVYKKALGCVDSILVALSAKTLDFQENDTLFLFPQPVRESIVQR